MIGSCQNVEDSLNVYAYFFETHVMRLFDLMY